MNLVYGIKLATFALCVINYALILYRNDWDFSKMESVGWLMAVLGWLNVVA